MQTHVLAHVETAAHVELFGQPAVLNIGCFNWGATAISMSDTTHNRAEYEYAGGQKKGCGFPTGKLLGVFSLATGHLHCFIHGNWKQHDIGMARRVIGWLNPGEVPVADRGFCGWGLMALLARKQVDVVIRLHARRDASSHLDHWDKPQRQGDWDKDLWAELPDVIAVRIVRYKVDAPGFRTKEVVLVTYEELKHVRNALEGLWGTLRFSENIAQQNRQVENLAAIHRLLRNQSPHVNDPHQMTLF